MSIHPGRPKSPSAPICSVGAEMVRCTRHTAVEALEREHKAEVSCPLMAELVYTPNWLLLSMLHRSTGGYVCALAAFYSGLCGCHSVRTEVKQKGNLDCRLS